jgi:hypothetical protein
MFSILVVIAYLFILSFLWLLSILFVFVVFLRSLDGEFLVFVVITGVKHLRGPADCRGFWEDRGTAEKESSGNGVEKILSLRRGHRPAGSRRRGAKLTLRAGVRPLDEYICNKEETRIEAPKYRRSEIRVFP